jgi:tRNA modification GTPase
LKAGSQGQTYKKKPSMNRSTIAAIATPYGSGGIGIIRISGDASIKISERIFRRSGGAAAHRNPKESRPLKSHRLYHGYIVDTNTRTRIDEVLLVVMKAPKSYTREDVVEIQSHSGHVVMSQLFETVLNAGARIAEPGEFTRRAFLNGRIDLTQAEAVIDTINAKSSAALRIATRQLEGHLKVQIDRIWNALQSVLVELEAAIDFSNETEDRLDWSTIRCRLEQEILPALEMLLQRYRQGRYFREGARLAVVGRPNVGKSSLLNCLVEKDRAIVTGIPGTTRDVIEESLNINGLPVVIMDTAGLQDAAGEVERLSIEKTQESIQGADIILFVIDSSREICDEDRRIYEMIRQKTHIVVQNKVDIILKERSGELPATWAPCASVQISAREGLYIETLKQQIQSLLVQGQGVIDDLGVVPNARHRKKIEKGRQAVKRAVEDLQKGVPVEIAAIDIKEALDSIGEVVGYRGSSDLLEEIFSRFCIGK